MNLLKQMNKFVSSDKSRRRLQGIYRDLEKQCLVATDGKVLLAVPYPVKETGTYFYNEDRWESALSRFEWSYAIPNDLVEANIDVSALLEKVQEMLKTNGAMIKFYGSYYYPKDFYRGLKFFLNTGALPFTSMYYSKNAGRKPILFTDTRIKYVFMPVIGGGVYTKVFDLGEKHVNV